MGSGWRRGLLPILQAANEGACEGAAAEKALRHPEPRRPYKATSQKAMAAAAATFRESTPWAMGMRTV